MRKARVGDYVKPNRDSMLFGFRKGVTYKVIDDDRWDDGTGVTIECPDSSYTLNGGPPIEHEEYEIVGEQSDLRKAIDHLKGKAEFLETEIYATDKWVESELYDIHEELAAMDEAISHLEDEMDEIKKLLSPRAKRRTDRFRGGCI